MKNNKKPSYDLSKDRIPKLLSLFNTLQRARGKDIALALMLYDRQSLYVYATITEEEDGKMKDFYLQEFHFMEAARTIKAREYEDFCFDQEVVS